MHSAIDPTTSTTYHSYSLSGIKFIVDSRCRSLRPIGRGAFGFVCEAVTVNPETGLDERVAIKRIRGGFASRTQRENVWREVGVLQDLHHENILQLRFMYRPPRCDDLYVATEMMDMDLEGLLGSGAFGWLTKDHGRFLGYQVLRGLKALHDVGIMHRDVKPANILVDRRCHVKLCDFGLCAPITSYPNTDPTSTYIATRWYRAPEIVFPGGLYNEKVDIWAAGCVITEILTRRSPFPGESSMDQRTRLMKAFNMPHLYTPTWPALLKDIHDRQHLHPSLDGLERDMDEQANDLISRHLLIADPLLRVSAKEALTHEFFRGLHDPTDE